jgi:hypothetical protein
VRSLAIDFDLTVLLPLILVGLGVLWNLVLPCLKSRSKWRETRGLLWLASIALVSLCVLWAIPDRIEVFFADGAWNVLWIVGAASVMISIPMAWHYANEREWIKFWTCVLVLLIAAGSTEHLFHQRINARHVNCPHCSDDDDRPDEN